MSKLSADFCELQPLASASRVSLPNPHHPELTLPLWIQRMSQGQRGQEAGPGSPSGPGVELEGSVRVLLGQLQGGPGPRRPRGGGGRRGERAGASGQLGGRARGGLRPPEKQQALRRAARQDVPQPDPGWVCPPWPARGPVQASGPQT